MPTPMGRLECGRSVPWARALPHSRTWLALCIFELEGCEHRSLGVIAARHGTCFSFPPFCCRVEWVWHSAVVSK